MTHPDEPEPRLTFATLQAENQRLDRLLQVFVFVLAFLLALFPIQNSDVWLQLRTGQLIAQGNFSFGKDPFCYTTNGVWHHTAWLWDLAAYGIYELGGGPALVLFRGILALGITACMLAMRRKDGSHLTALLCVVLGVVAMSARWRFRSEMISVFFLALTLYLLHRPPRAPHWGFLAKPFTWTLDRAWVFLPAIFMLWANCDYWFFLGPVAVALYWVGDKLQGAVASGSARDARSARESNVLLAVLLIGTALCLVNPNHYHVFQLPGELHSEALRQITSRTDYARLNVSPFNFGLYWVSGRLDSIWYRPRGLSLAEWAFYPLVVLGFVSFVLNWFRAPWSRVLLWLGFFALGAYQRQNVAFFAVVAAPLMALNFQEWLLARTTNQDAVSRRRVILLELARLASLGVILMTCLAVLRVDYLLDPRSLFGSIPRSEGLIHRWRGFGLSTYEDASQKSVAEQLAKWQGDLPGRPFFFDWRSQPDYDAWFNPGGQWFLDERFALHDNGIREYFDVRLALEGTGFGPPEQRDERIRQVFEKYDVSHLVISQDFFVRRPDPQNPGRERSSPLVDLLLSEVDRHGRPKWIQLAYMDGRNFILGWAGSKHREALAKLSYDAQEQAFRRPHIELPGNAPVGEEGPSSFVNWITGRTGVESLGVSAAAWHNELANQAVQQGRFQVQWDALVYFPMAGSPANVLSGVPLPSLQPLDIRMDVLGRNLKGAEPYLAIRAARQAIIDSYAEGEVAGRITRSRAHGRLYQSYTNLYQLEGEVSPRNLLRDLQVMASLRQALADQADQPPLERDPTYGAMQLDMVGTYLRKGYLDMAVVHYQQVLDWAAALGHDRDRFEADLRQMPQPAMRQLADEMKRVENNHKTLRSRLTTTVGLNADSATRAQVALGLKLADEARQAMEKTIQDYGSDVNNRSVTVAMNQLVNLYLELGYLPEARMLLKRPDAIKRLGPYNYYDLTALVAGVMGEYESALSQRRAADEIIKHEMADKALMAAQLQTLGGLSEPPGSNLSAINQWNEANSYASRRAEQWVQMGQLALEAGWTQPRPPELKGRQIEAAECFRKAVEDVNPQSGFRILASRYHQFITGQYLNP